MLNHKKTIIFQNLLTLLRIMSTFSAFLGIFTQRYLKNINKWCTKCK